MIEFEKKDGYFYIPIQYGNDCTIEKMGFIRQSIVNSLGKYNQVYITLKHPTTRDVKFPDVYMIGDHIIDNYIGIIKSTRHIIYDIDYVENHTVLSPCYFYFPDDDRYELNSFKLTMKE